jgi:hypothetical protein
MNGGGGVKYREWFSRKDLFFEKPNKKMKNNNKHIKFVPDKLKIHYIYIWIFFRVVIVPCNISL